MFFCKKKKKKELEDNTFKMSIMMDRERQDSVKGMKLFLNELIKRNIEVSTFASGLTMFTYYLKDRDRYCPFNICVDKKYKEDVLEIHKMIYGF